MREGVVTALNQPKNNFDDRTFSEKIFWWVYEWSNKPWVFYPLFAVMISYIAFSNLLSVGINFTESMPSKYYVFSKHFDKDALAVGDVVQYEYRNDKFFPFGSKFVKVVAGIEGDVIEHIGQDIYINGKHIGAAKLFAGYQQEKEPLDMTPPGVIPKNHLFLYTPYEHSFDSRYVYVGLAHKDRITGVNLIDFGQVEVPVID